MCLVLWPGDMVEKWERGECLGDWGEGVGGEGGSGVGTGSKKIEGNGDGDESGG